jgi:hypothetical protein
MWLALLQTSLRDVLDKQHYSVDMVLAPVVGAAAAAAGAWVLLMLMLLLVPGCWWCCCCCCCWWCLGAGGGGGGAAAGAWVVPGWCLVPRLEGRQWPPGDC